MMFLYSGRVESPITEIDPGLVTTSREPDYDPYDLMMSDHFDSSAIAIGVVTQNEISGIEFSSACDRKLWAINDSGNGPFLYLLDGKTAEIQCTYHLPNLINIDWEDISLSRQNDGSSYLLIGDLGNNFLNRTKQQIYRFKEPDCQCENEGKINIRTDYEKFDFVYPDGPHNAEAFFVDDETQDIYIITKENKRSGVYLFPSPQQSGQTHTLTYLGSLPFPLAVAADYCLETKTLFIKTYEKIFMWENYENKKISDLIFDPPMNAPYHPVELQGESLCIGPSGYYTLSEKVLGIEPILYFYNKKIIR
jgi:hypothetical protein